MGFKRYGGSWGGSDVGTDKKISYCGIIILVLCSVATLLTGNAVFIVSGFVIMFIAMIIGSIPLSSRDTADKKSRHQMYLDRGLEEFHKGDYSAANGSFLKAKIYGEIPKSHMYEYTQSIHRVMAES